MQNLYLDNTQVSDFAPLAGLIALQTLWLNDTQADANAFRNQYPPMPAHARRYANFVAAMVYGEQTEFGVAMKTVADMVDVAWPA